MASKLKTLDRIREVEREVHGLKTQAEEERERILRDAKREALNLEDDLRNEAEEGFREILTAARERIETQRQDILAEGRREADTLKEAGSPSQVPSEAGCWEMLGFSRTVKEALLLMAVSQGLVTATS